MLDVAALGEILIDFTPAGRSAAGQRLLEENPGGAPANVLAALAKLGKRTAFLGMAGRDQFGTYLREVLRRQGIDVTGFKLTGAAHTTLAFVHLNESGDRQFSFYRDPGADLMFSEGDIEYDLIRAADVFHFGSISMTGEPARGATLAAVKFAKAQKKLISYDPNYRPLLWPDPAQAQATMRLGLEYADLVKVSESELELLTGTADLELGSAALMEYGVRLAFVTLGPQGCFYRAPFGTGRLPTYAVPVVDTTGAGDAFLGAILYHLSGRNAADLERLDRGELERMIDFANAAGALTTTQKGAIPALPGLEQVQRCLAQLSKLPAG
jgi:fructokinase